ncbi:MAG: dihydroorotase [Bacteroidota bacterium]
METSKPFLLTNATIINEGVSFTGSLLIQRGIIQDIFSEANPLPDTFNVDGLEIIDLSGKHLIPGVIDDQVHFREPGLTYKADIYTESKAAVAGGVTSFMDMPNTKPGTLTQELLKEKYDIAAEKSLANYSFYMGTSNDNIIEVLKTDPRNVCGIKVFLGASTGNMLVDDPDAIQDIFSKSKMLIAVHCEEESIIKENLLHYQQRFNSNIPPNCHSLIRSDKACFSSSKKAKDVAEKYGTRLHILHLSTASEMKLFDNTIPLKDKKITAEVCVHHLWFNDRDYETKGNLIKWNPAIKTFNDRDALINALNNDTIDIVATDHAPHTLEEKLKPYLEAPSGGPLVQHSLQIMLEMYKKKIFSLEKIIDKMCHAPAVCFKVEKRGFLRKGYHADLCVFDLNQTVKVSKENILYKCNWSPFEGYTFNSAITHTFVNGNLVYCNQQFDESVKGQRLLFEI